MILANLIPKFPARERNTITNATEIRRVPQTWAVKGDTRVRYLSTGPVWKNDIVPISKKSDNI